MNWYTVTLRAYDTKADYLRREYHYPIEVVRAGDRWQAESKAKAKYFSAQLVRIERGRNGRGA